MNRIFKAAAFLGGDNIPVFCIPGITNHLYMHIDSSH